MKFFSDDSPQYQPVGAESDSPPIAAKKRFWVWWLLGLLFITIVGAGCGTVGYRMGENAHWGLLAPIGNVDHTFHYNSPFGQHPGNESDHWWSIIFPKGRGFVQHPELSPNPMGLSVFHQLHCLDALRRSYYAALDGVEPDMHMKPAHVRHCIDYLRQSIMCHADTNLEPIDPVLGGVTGWGFNRKCRDIVGLIAWANKYRTHDQTSHD